MRSPASIKPHLSIDQMFRWLQSAPDESSHKRRMAIWLTHTGQLYANQVAKVLGVSVQAVWLWIRQYNAAGPTGLDRTGRGGRRWGFLTPAQEAKLLSPYKKKMRKGIHVSPSEVKQKIEQTIGRGVSNPYVYRLLQRHQWSRIVGQAKVSEQADKSVDDFTKVAQPWLRRS